MSFCDLPAWARFTVSFFAGFLAWFAYYGVRRAQKLDHENQRLIIALSAFHDQLRRERERKP